MAENRLVYPRVSTKVSKLGAQIACVNLPPGETCGKSVPCTRTCYAKRGNFSYPATKESIIKNYEAYQRDPIGFFRVIDRTLNMLPYRYFRWHSSGDIPDEQYLDLMFKLARRHRSTKFLCFTKKFELVNNYLGHHPKPGNLIIVLSNWGDWHCDNPHRLPTAWVKLSKTEFIPAYARKCSGYCGNCVNTTSSCWDLKKGEAVWFKKH